LRDNLTGDVGEAVHSAVMEKGELGVIQPEQV
jgi:hypothetical protein